MTQAEFNESVNREVRRLIRQGEEKAAAMNSAGPKQCINCNTKPERPDSIYCSDACRNAFLYFPQEPKPSKFTIVERWDGQKWIEVRLEWNGTEYKESR